MNATVEVAVSAATVIRRMRTELRTLSESGKAVVPIAQLDQWLADLDELAAKHRCQAHHS